VAAKLPGGCHKGQLTRVGQQQALGLGKWLRARYVEQLGFVPREHEVRASGPAGAQLRAQRRLPAWHVPLPRRQRAPPQFRLRTLAQPGCLSARTTNFQRTIACVRGVLTGLYPNSKRAIPVTTTLVKEEVLCAGGRLPVRTCMPLNGAKSWAHGAASCIRRGPAGAAELTAPLAWPPPTLQTQGPAPHWLTTCPTPSRRSPVRHPSCPLCKPGLVCLRTPGEP
jgi:hypothetical protein